MQLVYNSNFPYFMWIRCSRNDEVGGPDTGIWSLKTSPGIIVHSKPLVKLWPNKDLLVEAKKSFVNSWLIVFNLTVDKELHGMPNATLLLWIPGFLQIRTFDMTQMFVFDLYRIE